jgi:hypothetical protein
MGDACDTLKQSYACIQNFNQKIGCRRNHLADVRSRYEDNIEMDKKEVSL